MGNRDEARVPNPRNENTEHFKRNLQDRYTSSYNQAAMATNRQGAFGGINYSPRTVQQWDPWANDGAGGYVDQTVYDSQFNFDQPTQGLVDSVTQGTQTAADLYGDNIGRSFYDEIYGGAGSDATIDRLNQIGSRFLTPMLQQQRGALEQQRATQGIEFGSDAWNQLESNLNRRETDALGQLIMNNYGQVSADQARRFGALHQDRASLGQAVQGGVGIRNALAQGALGTIPGGVGQFGQLGARDALTASNAVQGDRERYYQNMNQRDNERFDVWEDAVMPIGSAAISYATGVPAFQQIGQNFGNYWGQKAQNNLPAFLGGTPGALG